MWGNAQRQMLDGGRLHLSHGPIDVVLKAWGQPQAIADAEAAAAERFPDILGELVGELALLRAPCHAETIASSPVGQRMVAGCLPFCEVFVTPMAAVAGSVADELLDVMRQAAPLERAFVNDGGDIAVYLAPGQEIDIGVAGNFAQTWRQAVDGRLRLEAAFGIGGVATSGWGGRSLSLGLADSVTVLAACAAEADVAATLIANEVTVASPAVQRAAASSLDPDSDLGDRMVTVSLGPLASCEIDHALRQGLAAAEAFRARGLIRAAALSLQGRSVVTGHDFKLIEEDRR